MVLIDAALVLFVGLAVLIVWRYLCAWRCCGKWLQYANYCSLLLGLLIVILVYDSFCYLQVAFSPEGKASWDNMPSWLRPWLLSAPGICLAVYVFSSVQTFQHVERIREDTAVVRHDRAVQIILLPAVYSVMGMSSITRIFLSIAASHEPHSTNDKEMLNRALSRSETCFWVGDLYEAWALFQFGKLTLEVIESGIMAQTKSTDQEVAAAANGLRISHRAVESLAWLGILAFLLVCVAQAGWSLWLLTVSKVTSHSFHMSMAQFTVAGFLASCAAIYNIYIVEESYHTYLETYYPRLKFITVKILVTFAYVQRGLLSLVMSSGSWLPEATKDAVDKMPFIGTLMNFSRGHFELFYGVLIITECFFVCIAHYWAWDSGEMWYDEADVAELMKGDDLETLQLKGRSNNPFAPGPNNYGAQSGR